jgi:hypothetical protein
MGHVGETGQVREMDHVSEEAEMGPLAEIVQVGETAK